MGLHRAIRPDWEDPSLEKSNFWQRMAQRIAAKTNGYITPGNAVTLGGGVIFYKGLRDFSNGRYAQGSIKIAAALACDVMDGKIADMTGTKSPKGEALDATVDKLEIAMAIPTLQKLGAISSRQAVALVTQNGANSVLAVIARAEDNRLHPSRAGKLTRTAQSVSIVAGVASVAARAYGHESVASHAERINTFSAAGALGLGIVATAGYARELWQAPRQEAADSELAQIFEQYEADASGLHRE